MYDSFETTSTAYLQKTLSTVITYTLATAHSVIKEIDSRLSAKLLLA